MATRKQIVAKILCDAAELLQDPDNWTQGSNARRKDGSATYSKDPSACCWCPEGALHKFSPDEECAQDALDVIQRAVPDPDPEMLVYLYNDVKGRKHSDITAMMWQGVAIAISEARAQGELA